MTTPTRNHPAAQAAALASVAAIALLALQRLAMPTPPVTDAHGLLEFLRTQGALVTAAGGIRWLALLAGTYVLVIAVLALLASIGPPSPHLVKALRSVTIPSLRWLLPTVIGLGSITMPAAGAALPTAKSLGNHATTHLASSSTTTAANGTDDLVALPEPTTTERDGGAGTATFSYEGPVSSPSSGTHPTTARPLTSPTSSGTPKPSATAPPTTPGRETTLAPHHAAAPHLTEAPPASAVTPPRQASARRARPETGGSANWTVRRGDHLWHIAEATLAVRNGSAPDEAVVATYWRRLIEANREALLDPSNPDLILPGQVFVLPES